MSITYPLVHPSTPGFRSIRLSPQNAVAVTESPYSLATQVQAHQGQRWIADVTLPPIKQDTTADEWAAWLTALRGRYGTFLLGDSSRKEPRGSMALVNSEFPAPYIHGAGQTGMQLVTRGWLPGAEGVIKYGDYIQIGGANLLLRSNELENSAWGKSNVTITPNAISGPDTSSTIADIVTAGVGDCNLYQGFTQHNTGSHTFSIYLKVPSGTLPLSIALHSGTAYNATKSVVLTTEWRRFYVTGDCDGGGSPFVSIGRPIDIPDGAVFHACYAQVNPGDTPDAYIQTVAESVNRKRYLHKVISERASDLNGQIIIDIWPQLRSSPVGDSFIKIHNCVGTFRMAEEPSWDVDEAKLYGISFRAVEDI